MRIKDKIRAELIICKIADRAGKPPAEVRRDMQTVINEAWQNPANAEEQRRRFPAGKPTVDEFVLQIAREIRRS